MGGQFPDEARPAGGFHRPAPPEALAALFNGPARLDARQGPAAALAGGQAKAALLPCPQAHPLAGMSRCNPGQLLFQAATVEGGEWRVFFWGVAFARLLEPGTQVGARPAVKGRVTQGQGMLGPRPAPERPVAALALLPRRGARRWPRAPRRAGRGRPGWVGRRAGAHATPDKPPGA